MQMPYVVLTTVCHKSRVSSLGLAPGIITMGFYWGGHQNKNGQVDTDRGGERFSGRERGWDIFLLKNFLCLFIFRETETA